MVRFNSDQASELFDAHMRAELASNLDVTMETMVSDPHLINLASGTGGRVMFGNSMLNN